MQSRVRTLWLGIAVLGLGLFGCSDGCRGGKGKPGGAERKDAGEKAPEKLSTPRSTVVTGVDLAAKPKTTISLPNQKGITLARPGKGPRRVYRYQPPLPAKSPSPGASSESQPAEARSLVISATTRSRELKAGVWSPRVELPQIRYGLTLTLAGASGKKPGGKKPGGKKPGGKKAQERQFLFHLLGLPAEVAKPGRPGGKQTEDIERGAEEFVAKYRKHVERRRGSIEISERGFLGKMTLLPPSLSESAEGHAIRQHMQQLLVESIVPLPREAIGKGARWKAITIMRRDAAMVTQTAKYELIGVQKGRLRIAAEITQIAERQILEMPEMPAGITPELVALFWQARGQLEVDPAWPTPVSGTLDIEMRAHTRLIQATGMTDYFIENLGRAKLESAPPGKK